MDWKLELVIVPVTDVDRAKKFYTEQLGFAEDVDHSAGDVVPGGAADPAGFGLLDHDRHRPDHGGARRLPGHAPGGERHRGGPRRAGRARCRGQRAVPLHRRGAAARPGPEAGPSTARS